MDPPDPDRDEFDEDNDDAAVDDVNDAAEDIAVPCSTFGAM